MKTQLFINKFQKGSNESANLGQGSLVGIDTYSKKGVAILAKKSTIVTTNFTAQPHFIETSQAGTYTWVQCADGSVLYSADGGNTWQATATPFPSTGSQNGNGLKLFQNFMFAWTDTKIYYWKDTGIISGSDPTAGAWVDWTTTKSLGLLQNFQIDPIAGLHFPELFPNNRAIYFGNGNAGGTSNATAGICTIGLFGQVGSTLFNPGGTINVDFLWNGGVLTLPSYTYTIGSLNFLPPSSLAICVNAYQNPSQGSFVITWDTVSANKFTPPIQIFSNSLAQPSGSSITTAGIKQVYNRNQVLYSVTGGNHSIYETNGSSFNLLEDIGLYSNVRFNTGSETDIPVYFNSYPQAICVVGNKLLTGVATMTNTDQYPPNIALGNNMGLFPIGVWSIAFNLDGSHTTQCEFSLPKGNVLISPDETGYYAKITCIRPIPQTTGATGTPTNQLAIGYGYKTINENSGNATFGVAVVDLYKYIDNLAYTAIESELFEIGTAINPQTVNLIEVNLVKNLMVGHSIDISYRTGQDQAWTVIDTYTGDGTKNYYHTDSNPIGATQFVQLRVRMASGAPNPTYSPQLKTVTLS